MEFFFTRDCGQTCPTGHAPPVPDYHGGETGGTMAPALRRYPHHQPQPEKSRPDDWPVLPLDPDRGPPLMEHATTRDKRWGVNRQPAAEFPSWPIGWDSQPLQRAASSFRSCGRQYFSLRKANNGCTEERFRETHKPPALLHPLQEVFPKKGSHPSYALAFKQIW